MSGQKRKISAIPAAASDGKRQRVTTHKPSKPELDEIALSPASPLEVEVFSFSSARFNKAHPSVQVSHPYSGTVLVKSNSELEIVHPFHTSEGVENLQFWLRTSCSLNPIINVKCFGDAVSSSLAQLMPSTLPCVRHLEVHCCDVGGSDDESEDDDEEEQDTDEEEGDYVSVQTLSVDKAPALRSAVLYNCILPWRVDLFSKLTRLEVHINAPLPDEKRPTHAQLCAMITSMGRIEELHLDNIFPKYSTDASEVLAPIVLPSTCKSVTLRSRCGDWVLMRPSDGHMECCKLATSLKLPSSAVLTVIQNCQGNVGRVLGEMAGRARRPTAISIGASYDVYCGVVVVGLDTSPWIDSPVQLLDSTPGGHVIFFFEPTSSSWTERGSGDTDPGYEHVLSSMSSMDLTALRVLRVEGMEVGGEERLLLGHKGFTHNGRTYPPTAPLLAQAKRLEILILPEMLQDGTFCTFLDALGRPAPATDEYLFPRLHTVVMLWDPMSYNLHTVVDFFTARHKAGFPVAKLQVLQRDGKVESWKDLQKITEVELYEYPSR